MSSGDANALLTALPPDADLATRLKVLQDLRLQPEIPVCRFGEKWWEQQLPVLSLLLNAMVEMDPDEAKVLFATVTSPIDAANSVGVLMARIIYMRVRRLGRDPLAVWLRKEALRLVGEAGYMQGKIKEEAYQGEMQPFVQLPTCKYVLARRPHDSFPRPMLNDRVAFREGKPLANRLVAVSFIPLTR